MKAVLLCAGYGTRLTKDLECDKSGNFIHLCGIPKPLLPVGSQPLISYWLDILSSSPEISEVVLVSNESHKRRYEIVVDDYRKNDLPFSISVISDGSSCNESRTGAVSCMKTGAGNFKEDTIFIAGDTLLDFSFNLREMIEHFKKLKCTVFCDSIIISAPVLVDNDVSKRGIIEIDSHNRVTSFLEKPDPSETLSRLQSPCVYIMSPMCSVHLENFLLNTSNQPLSTRDAPGNFIKYLISQTSVYAYYVKKRYDIGNLQSYIECNKIFQDRKLKS